ncbi:MAG TPA: AI-2E family transporter [Humisphaera sp.]
MRLPTPTQRIERLLHTVLIGGLVVGVIAVLFPLLPAILFAIVMAVSTWPVFTWVLGRVRGRRGFAGLICCFGVVVALVAPTALVAISAADAIPRLFSEARHYVDAHGPPLAPDWLRTAPIVGPGAAGYWDRVAGSRDEQAELLRLLGAKAGDTFQWLAGRVGDGMVQVGYLLVAVFLLFFFYRDGNRMAVRAEQAAERVGGPTAREMLTVAQQTVVGVMLGMVATAVAQGLVASLGFVIAGVPGAILLGAATFVLSILPFGPPIVWGGAAIYLYSQGQVGWAIFMALYGALVISMVDNLLKPLLISRTSKMPLALTLLGVAGGVLAFGFVGLFVGPTLLAVAVNLTDRWLARQLEGPAAAAAEKPVAPMIEPEAAGETRDGRPVAADAPVA